MFCKNPSCGIFLINKSLKQNKKPEAMLREFL